MLSRLNGLRSSFIESKNEEERKKWFDAIKSATITEKEKKFTIFQVNSLDFGPMLLICGQLLLVITCWIHIYGFSCFFRIFFYLCRQNSILSLMHAISFYCSFNLKMRISEPPILSLLETLHISSTLNKSDTPSAISLQSISWTVHNKATTSY